MDRRAFLGIIPTAALTSKAMGVDFTKISTSEGPIYRGYRIWEWTGWKPAQNTSTLVGQWLAAPVDENGNYFSPDGPSAQKTGIASYRSLLFVSVPGAEGGYGLKQGMIYPPEGAFDNSLRRGQILIEKRTPEHIKERERRKGLKRMFRLIDETVS